MIGGVAEEDNEKEGKPGARVWTSVADEFEGGSELIINIDCDLVRHLAGVLDSMEPVVVGQLKSMTSTRTYTKAVSSITSRYLCRNT